MQTKNFKPEVDKMMSCPCCGEGGLSISILLVLEDIRRHFNTSVTINSGARCVKHNKKVGGASKSEHLSTTDEPLVGAVDIVVTGVSPTKVVAYLKQTAYSNLIGIGKYRSWTHVDTRGYAARW